MKSTRHYYKVVLLQGKRTRTRPVGFGAAGTPLNSGENTPSKNDKCRCTYLPKDARCDEGHAPTFGAEMAQQT